MHAEESKLRNLIETTKQFVIPLFQRFYVWDKVYWDTLWVDIIDLFDEEKGVTHSHFLGSLVLIPDETSSVSLQKFTVIDGQQRLVTLQILLAAIRDIAKKNGEPKLASEIEDKMLFNKYMEENDGFYKLMLSENDQLAFKKILDNENHELNHRLTDCYKFFEKHILKNDHISSKSLFEIIANHLSLVAITLNTEENPYLVFESLNFKGQKLTEADLIRNYLFMRVPQKKQKQIHQKYWKPIEDQLSNNITEFFRHYLMHSGDFVKQSEVYVTFKKRIASHNAPDTIESIKELADFSVYYAKLLDPNLESNEALRENLKRLNRLEITTIYPFLLNLYRDYHQKSLSVDDFCQIVSILENYLLRRFICNLPSSELNKIFPPLYHQIQKQTDGNFLLSCKIILQNKSYPSDNQVRKDLLERKLYGRGDREKKTRFILESLEKHYKHKETVQFGKLTIEHVMPQTLDSWWKDHLGDQWSEVHENYLHTIGNLTLTGYNGELSNNAFPDKRKKFINSNLMLNKYFQTVENWHQSEILKRSHHLIDVVLEIWPYFGDPSFKQTDPSHIVGRKPNQLIIGEKSIPVKTWREVLQVTLESLAHQSPNDFSKLAEEYPQYVALSPHGLRNAKSLSDNQYYYESNLGAQSIHRFCKKAIETLGLPPTAWDVKVEKD